MRFLQSATSSISYHACLTDQSYASAFLAYVSSDEFKNNIKDLMTYLSVTGELKDNIAW